MLKADVFHIAEPGYAQLLSNLVPQRTVVNVHDLIPLLRYKGVIHGVQPGRRPWFAEYSLLTVFMGLFIPTRQR